MGRLARGPFSGFGGPTWRTRNGNAIHSTPAVDAGMARLALAGVVLDGELVAGSCDEAVSITSTQDVHGHRHAPRFATFDLLTTAEWASQQCAGATVQRKAKLAAIPPGLVHVEAVASTLANTATQGDDALRCHVAAGFEGVVYKAHSTAWTGRTATMLARSHVGRKSWRAPLEVAWPERSGTERRGAGR